MRPFTSTISLDAARDILNGAGTPMIRTERIPLDQASGRVLAADVIAGADVPPFARALMDGYAVRAGDTGGAARDRPRLLRRIGVIYTGDVPTLVVGEGTCMEIATGAPMPAGADGVVMVEETACDADGRVSVFSEVQPHQNVGRRGVDIAAGQTVVRGNETLNSSRIGALAAVGMPDVNVYERVKVAIVSTGNEVVAPGRPLNPGQIYNVNRFTLTAVVSENGGIPLPYPPVPDSLDSLIDTLDECVRNDLVVFSGGSSVGERDLMRDAIAARGTMLFHGIAVKPGKPTGFALIGDTPVLALPGYPTSCLSNAHILLVPLLRRLARLPPRLQTTIQVPMRDRVMSTAGRLQVLSVKIEDGCAVPVFKGSGDITSMSRAEGYIEIPAPTEVVEAGTPVLVTLF